MQLIQVTVRLQESPSQSTQLDESTIFSALKHLNPVPRITLLQNDSSLKYRILLAGKETAQEAIAVIQRRKFKIEDIGVAVEEPDEEGVCREPESKILTEKNQRENLRYKREQELTKKPKFVNKLTWISYRGSNSDDFHASGENRGLKEKKPCKNSKLKENKGTKCPGSYYNLSNNKFLAAKVLNDKSNKKHENASLKPPVSKNAVSASKFVKVENLNMKRVDPSILFNLLGIVGNVKKVLLDSDKGLAIAEMAQEKQAQLACEFFHNTLFFGALIRVTIYPIHINWSDLYISPDSNIKVISGNSKYYRYKPNLSIKVNRPSKLIHMTNVASDLTLADICKLFSIVNEPNMITKLETKGKKSDMYLIEFQSEEEGLEVLTTYHDQVLNDLRLKLSFSHMRTDKKTEKINKQ